MFLFIFQRKRQAYESNLICHGLQLEATRSVSVSLCGTLCEPLCLGACASWSWGVAWETCSHSHTAGRVGRETEPVVRAREMVRQAKAYATEAWLPKFSPRIAGLEVSAGYWEWASAFHTCDQQMHCVHVFQRGSFQFSNLQFPLLYHRTLAENVMLFHQWPYSTMGRYKTDEAANFQI